MKTISFMILTAACFVAAVLNLALDTKFKKFLIRISAIVSGVVGILLYGYGFSYVEGETPVLLIRALLAVCRMFAGGNELSTVAEAPLLKNHAVVIIFWLAHFLSFYTTASATITVVGGRLLRRIRMRLLRRGTLVLIYGVNARSLAYGRSCAAQKDRSVLFIDAGCDAGSEAAITAMGAVLERSAEAASPTPRFLHSIGMRPGHRHMEAAALHANSRSNLAFATSLADALAQTGVRPEQTHLLLAGVEEDMAGSLMARGGKGFGSVFAFDEYTLAARLLMRKLPPCSLIRFDETARAAEDYQAVIVGFGRMGRAVLEQMVMNGQFEGSAFRVDVFDPGPQNGVLFHRPVLEEYDVRFHAFAAQSTEFYAHLKDRGEKVRCIVLCTGDALINSEIAGDLQEWYRCIGHAPAIVQCTPAGLICLVDGEQDVQYQSIYASGLLDVKQMDSMAMQINQMYCGETKRTALQNWQLCDYFSRMSSRAAADFYPAMLAAAGKTNEQVRQGQWPPDEIMMENLARTEHRRWCAFHHVMGFQTMTPEQYHERAEMYRQQLRSGQKPTVRIGKDVAGRRHACLIPWEELDALSERENAVTHGQVDYKESDVGNVRAVPLVLSAMEGDCA